MYCNNGETCVAAAESGGGVIYQPDFLVQQALQQGRLIQLCPDYQGLTLPVCAVYPSRRFVSAKVRTLVSFLLEQLTAE
jgi:DNA-binding transcriptional LysR family regulator